MTHPGKTLSLVVILMIYLPAVAGLVLAGYLLGWKAPVAFLVVMGFFFHRALRGKSRRVPGRVRTIVEVLVFGLAGSIIGGFVFGALGVFFGFGVGLVMRLSEVPITPSRRRPRRT
jgi:hypothetical protein